MARIPGPEDLGDGWLPMSSAPRDGTIILVCELTPSGEEGNVLPAAYQNHLGHPLMEGFWGVWTTSHLPTHLCTQERMDSVREKQLPVNWKAIALTPLCWKPLPRPEAYTKLRRRQAQILAKKYPSATKQTQTATS